MLRPRRNAEVAEDKDEDENVIDAERVFDEVAGEKIERVVRAAYAPDQKIEAEREQNPDGAAHGGGAHAQLAIAPLETAQVERQRDEDAGMKRDPEPDARRHGA